MKNKKYNKIAIISFALVLLGGGAIPPVTIIGFILSIIALRQIRKNEEKGKMLAILSLIYGGLQVLFVVIAALLVLIRT